MREPQNVEPAGWWESVTVLPRAPTTSRSAERDQTTLHRVHRETKAPEAFRQHIPHPVGVRFLLEDNDHVVRMALSHLATRADKPSMQTTRSIYRGFCFPPEVIAHAVFLYHRFPLSLRDVEDLLAQRGIAVSYETIRRWCRRFGPHYARNVRRQRPTAGDHWLLDEVFLQIQGRRQYLWRAIDQDGDILDILMQRRRNGRAATRFVRKLLKQQQRSPNRFVTDKLGSYRVAHRAERASVPHDTTQYANNRIEASHRRTRIRERQMLRFRSAGNAQRFLSVQASILNLFNWGRHQLRAWEYRCFRARAFDAWSLAIHG